MSAVQAYERRTLREGEWMEHLGGIAWYYADVPRRLHRCRPQTRAWMDAELVERCACGSLRFDGHGPWIDRNSRKRLSAEERAEQERSRAWCDAADRLVAEFEDAVKAGDERRIRAVQDELRKLDAP